MSIVRNNLRRLGWFLIRTSRPKPAKGELDLSGDRDIEWSWVAGNLPANPGRVLDFGPSGATSPLIAAMRGGKVFTIDLEALPNHPYVHADITMVQGDLLIYDFGTQRFDTVINCSTVEHVGLPGRYGSADIPDGDLRAMRRLHGLMAGPESRMVMTIPVGLDGVFAPAHRIYGTTRLSALLEGFRIVREVYFAKSSEDSRWREISRDRALVVRGSASFYALGLFVLGLR